MGHFAAPLPLRMEFCVDAGQGLLELGPEQNVRCLTQRLLGRKSVHCLGPAAPHDNAVFRRASYQWRHFQQGGLLAKPGFAFAQFGVAGGQFFIECRQFLIGRLKFLIDVSNSSLRLCSSSLADWTSSLEAWSSSIEVSCSS